MIFIDIDGVLVDFIGTAKKFGRELAPNEFGRWKWGVDGYPAPEEFYAKAELQPWALELFDECYPFKLITKDFPMVKEKFLDKLLDYLVQYQEAPDKSVHCEHPCDVLIDDNAAECERWRKKGGIAWHFNLAAQDPFGEFLKWWGMGC